MTALLVALSILVGWLAFSGALHDPEQGFRFFILSWYVVLLVLYGPVLVLAA